MCGPMVRCPKCGMNCCSGAYGKVDGKTCDVCPAAYEHQKQAYDTDTVPKLQGPLPSWEDVTGVPPMTDEEYKQMLSSVDFD